MWGCPFKSDTADPDVWIGQIRIQIPIWIAGDFLRWEI
jgi:hypothetical protein